MVRIPGRNLASMTTSFGALGTDQIGADLTGLMGMLDRESKQQLHAQSRESIHTLGWPTIFYTYQHMYHAESKKNPECLLTI